MLIVYADIVFFENLIINYVILYVTVLIKKIKKSYFRILISSIIGSVYAIISITTKNIYINNIFFKILLSILMIIIISQTMEMKKIIENIALFYMLSITSGGAAIAVSYLTQGYTLKTINGIPIINFPILMSGIGLIIGITLIVFTIKNFKTKISKKDIFYDINIFIYGKSIKVRALLDTGNMLKDPLTNRPVIIVTKRSLSKIVPEPILDNINLIIGGDRLGQIINKEVPKRIKVIPFKSLGNEHGILIGIKSDKIIVDNCEIKDVIIGIYEKEFSRTKKYDALIGIDLLDEEECNYELNRKIKEKHKYNLC